MLKEERLSKSFTSVLLKNKKIHNEDKLVIKKYTRNNNY